MLKSSIFFFLIPVFTWSSEQTLTLSGVIAPKNTVQIFQQEDNNKINLEINSNHKDGTTIVIKSKETSQVYHKEKYFVDSKKHLILADLPLKEKTGLYQLVIQSP